MKYIKKRTAAFLAASGIMLAGSFPASAVNETGGTTNVLYTVAPSYTVTIPASVELSGSQETQPTPIKAEQVFLESGKQVTVALTGASNTDSGSTFHAKTDDGLSTAEYSISSGGAAIALNDTVAAFVTDGQQQLTFSKAEGASYAGVHSEVLTFTISVTTV